MRGPTIVGLLVVAMSGCVGPQDPMASEVLTPSPLEPSLLARITPEPTALVDALVTVEGGAQPGDAEALRGLGLTVLRTYEDFGVFFVLGAGQDILRSVDLPRVAYVAENAPIQFDLATAAVASRAREVWDTKTTSTNPVRVGGNILDGTDVGVAVVDTGVDGTHPDLADAVHRNRKFNCPSPLLTSPATQGCYAYSFVGITGCTDSSSVWAPLPDTDTGGHGTHVAGIVAGRGTASDGRYTGVAPGANIIGIGVGDYTFVVFALEAYQWIHCYHDQVEPRIRVVQNSWGPTGADGGGAYVPNHPINVAVNAMLADGLIVVWSAGNNGGTGNANVVNSYARNPTPGLISVADYSDADRATRAGALAAHSSRGLSTETNKHVWPDVSAPGSLVMSTRASSDITHPFALGDYEPYYIELSGTSMAAPHVSGIVALLLQARPTLTPGQVEDILEDTAVPFATPGGYVPDPANPTNGINYGSGHGLVDAVAALQDARVLATSGLGSRLPQLTQDPLLLTNGLTALRGSGETQWTAQLGVPYAFTEDFIDSGDPTTYPINADTMCGYKVVSAPAGEAVGFYACNNGLVRPDGVRWEMYSGTHMFLTPGVYKIESQVYVGSWPNGAFVSFDNFDVTVA